MIPAPGYRTSPTGRRLGVGTVAALHLALLLLLGAEARHAAPIAAIDRGSGSLSAIALLPGISAPDQPSAPQAELLLPSLAFDAPSRAAVPASSAAATTSLASEIAAAVGDDPGGEDSEQRYRTRLLRHIAHYRTHPGAAAPRAAGMVVVRFRIARSGDIVDARIVATQGALLDEAALTTLWRAEPLPDVPAGLAVPWEVDIPIDFAGAAHG